MSFSFGAPSATPTPSFSFNSNQQSPAKPAAFSFGNTANTNNAQASPGKPAAFSFGNTANTNVQASPGKPAAFSFGNTATTTNANTQASPAKFGNSFSFGGATTTSPSTSFSFGGSTNNTGSFSFGNNNTQQGNAAQDSSQINARFSAITTQIDGGEYDRFKFAFYNRGNQANYRKPDKMSDAMWRDAIARCPDSNSVPVLAHGFAALKARRDLQDKIRFNQEELINNIGGNIEEQAIRQQMLQDKFAESRKIVAHNITRILNILSKAESLRRKGQPLNRNEERLFSQLEKMKEELAKPGQYSSRVNDLMSNVKSQSVVSDNDYPSLDDESILKVQDILSNFITALGSLMKDVNGDAKALNLIEMSFQQSAIESSK